MPQTLKQKTIKGMGWSAIDNIAGTGTTFLVGLVLARLLSPEEFGTIGLIMVFVAVVQLFVDSGFSQALIRKRRVSARDYSTLFYFGIVVASVCYLGVYFGAVYVADFFAQPIFEPLLKVIGLTLFFNAFTLTQRVVLTRALDFKTQAFVTIVSAVLSGGVGVTMAYMGCGVWSLAAQITFRSAVQSVLLWVWCKWRPGWVWSLASLKEMFFFGYKLLISALIDTLFKNVFYVVIGKFHSTKSLGEYTRANQFSTLFSANLLSIVQKVSYPVLSSIKDEPERLLGGYRKLIKTTMLATFALMLGMAAVAKPMILILIGDQWLPAVYYLQILCFSEMLYPLHAINLNILNVKGRSDLFLRLEVIKKIIAIPMILAGIFYSIDAMLWCGVGVSVAAYFVNAHYSARLIGYSIGSQVRDILPTFLVSVVVAGVMWSVMLLGWNLYLTLFLQLGLGLGLALIIYERLGLEEYLEIKTLSLQALNKIRNVRK